jgi:Spy/CpxP family protein refolding chaperone
MMTSMRDMRTLSLQPSPDEQTVLAKQEEINKVQSEQALERTKLMLKIRSILNPDQRQKLVQLMQQRPGGQLGQGMPGGPGGPGGGQPGGQ